MKMLSIIREKVSATPCRSTWGRAVREDAVEILNSAIEEYGEGYTPDDLEHFEKILLNGAEGWKSYSYGGNALIYDRDIAEHYCTPSKFKASREGRRNPNRRENWLDVQARALFQAWRMIERKAK